jgi:hypothetical protein
MAVEDRNGITDMVFMGHVGRGSKHIEGRGKMEAVEDGRRWFTLNLSWQWKWQDGCWLLDRYHMLGLALVLSCKVYPRCLHLQTTFNMTTSRLQIRLQVALLTVAYDIYIYTSSPCTACIKFRRAWSLYHLYNINTASKDSSPRTHSIAIIHIENPPTHKPALSLNSKYAQHAPSTETPEPTRV